MYLEILNVRKSLPIVGIIALVICSSCGQEHTPANESLNLKYILIRRSGELDTVHRKIERWTQNDSFAVIVYKERWKQDTSVYQQTYKFPLKKEFDSLTQFQHLDTKTFEFEGKDYRIEKYLSDDEDGDDEEMLFFYSPDFGILFFRSAWWGNYERLFISGDKEKDRIVFYLSEMIANNDKDFFFRYANDR